MALPLEPPRAPELEPLDEWERAIADYRSTGMTLDEHPMELMRDGSRAGDPAQHRPRQVDDGATVEVAGMVVARQRPETAKGIVFMLLEDERGTVNLIVPPPVYERYRAAVRAAPLLRAKGRLERHEGTPTSSSPASPSSPPQNPADGPIRQVIRDVSARRPRCGGGRWRSCGPWRRRGIASGGGAEPAELSLSLRCCARCRQVPKARRARQ